MRIALSVIFLTSIFSMNSNAIEVRYNGFGDIGAGLPLGKHASSDDYDRLINSGEGEKFAKGEQDGFSLGGIDNIVTVELDDDIVFQTEVNLQVSRGSSSEVALDLERAYLDYSIITQFNIMAGLIFTPIGYINRNLYARAWMMDSIRVRDFAEEELGFMPTHSAGVNFHGKFDLHRDHTLMYALGSSNGRGGDPTVAVYSRDPDPWKEISLLLEYRNPRFENFRVGASAWTDMMRVNNYVSDKVTVGAQNVKFKETGYDLYTVFDNSKFGVLVEFASVLSKVKSGSLSSGSYRFTAFTGEFTVHLNGGRLHPYVRYDQTKLPGSGDSDSYWNVRSAANVYVPEFRAAMAGAAYDLTEFNRLKLEYIYHFDGPRIRHGVLTQAAFAF